MTDRELLELAAKAAGIKILRFGDSEDYYSPYAGYVAFVEWSWPGDGPDDPRMEAEWNPLEDAGDALRLAVTLGIKNYFEFNLQPLGAMVTCIGDERLAIHESTERQDLYAATRRAIVRAAAEIGREMK